MSTDRPEPPLARRSFVSRVGAGLAAFTGAFATPASVASAQPASATPWQPARHAQDDWFDTLPGQHRVFFDATSPTGAGEAITFANNFLVASRQGYGLAESENAVVIGLRHWATVFAFSDAIWAKYGAHIAERIHFTDPKTQAAPTINVYQAAGYGMQLPNRGTTLSDMLRRGAHFAICDMGTNAFAGLIAAKVNGTTKDIYDELRANAIGNAHFVAAGIVAVNRAQERGYAISHIG